MFSLEKYEFLLLLHLLASGVSFHIKKPKDELHPTMLQPVLPQDGSDDEEEKKEEKQQQQSSRTIANGLLPAMAIAAAAAAVSIPPPPPPSNGTNRRHYQQNHHHQNHHHQHLNSSLSSSSSNGGATIVKDKIVSKLESHKDTKSGKFFFFFEILDVFRCCNLIICIVFLNLKPKRKSRINWHKSLVRNSAVYFRRINNCNRRENVEPWIS